jgi:hypothetical protein
LILWLLPIARAQNKRAQATLITWALLFCEDLL